MIDKPVISAIVLAGLLLLNSSASPIGSALSAGTDVRGSGITQGVSTVWHIRNSHGRSANLPSSSLQSYSHLTASEAFDKT